jgi:23S rRNA pseudouridine2605 synthase
VGFNTLESLYNARFDPDKRIITAVAVSRGGYPPDACEGAISKINF